MLIHKIFPEPIYFSNLERQLTTKEIKTINHYKKKTHDNEGNKTSNANYVLENKILKNLKKDLNNIVLDYFDKVICTSSPIVPYITQSWINYTKTNQFHHKHSHPNSYISGVFYISADKEVDSIKFFKLNQRTIQPTIAKYNIFNSESWQYPVQTGNVVLFQSSLDHGVSRKKGNKLRISLSFNVFIKGKLGNKSGLTELTLQ